MELQWKGGLLNGTLNSRRGGKNRLSNDLVIGNKRPLFHYLPHYLLLRHLRHLRSITTSIY
jgi:hypothetical protein